MSVSPAVAVDRASVPPRQGDRSCSALASPARGSSLPLGMCAACAGGAQAPGSSPPMLVVRGKRWISTPASRPLGEHRAASAPCPRRPGCVRAPDAHDILFGPFSIPASPSVSLQVVPGVTSQATCT